MNPEIPLVGAQIRMARAALRWSLTELAEASNISEKTIRRCEAHDARPPVAPDTLVSLRKTFEAQGLRFMCQPETNGPCVCLGWDPVQRVADEGDD